MLCQEMRDSKTFCARERLALLASFLDIHTASAGVLDGVPTFNIGGDYHFKRLLLLDWPGGQVETHTFGDPGAGRF